MPTRRSGPICLAGATTPNLVSPIPPERPRYDSASGRRKATVATQHDLTLWRHARICRGGGSARARVAWSTLNKDIPVIRQVCAGCSEDTPTRGRGATIGCAACAQAVATSA